MHVRFSQLWKSMQLCGVKIIHTMFAINKVITLGRASPNGTVLLLNNRWTNNHGQLNALLKYVSKIYGLNWLKSLQLLDHVSDFSQSDSVLKIWLSRAWFFGFCLNVKSQRTKKIEVFSQGTDDSKNLRCETLYIGDYEYVNVSSFFCLGYKAMAGRRWQIKQKWSFTFILIHSVRVHILSWNSDQIP